jgi:nitrite reductase/ring-hydroxylating ferredoxin subunit
MSEIHIGSEDEFADRDRKVIAEGDLEIGVFYIDGEFYAYENRCTHQGGPVCQGRILNRVEEVLADDKTSSGMRWSDTDIHLVCPWHGYEFNIKTGRHPGDKNARMRPFDVKIKDGEVYVIT